jgi:hypothetical protein
MLFVTYGSAPLLAEPKRPRHREPQGDGYPLYGIITAWVKGVTFHDSDQSHEASSQDAVFMHSLAGIRRT